MPIEARNDEISAKIRKTPLNVVSFNGNAISLAYQYQIVRFGSIQNPNIKNMPIVAIFLPFSRSIHKIARLIAVKSPIVEYILLYHFFRLSAAPNTNVPRMPPEMNVTKNVVDFFSL